MSNPVKILSTEITLSSTVANNVSNAKLVRVINLADSPNDVVVTLAYANGTAKGTFTLGHDATGFSAIDLMKDPTDTLMAGTANSTVITRAVSIAYT